jgi:hypothetical protein
MNLLEIIKTVAFASVVVVIVGVTATAVMFINPSQIEEEGRIAGVIVDDKEFIEVEQINDSVTKYMLNLDSVKSGDTIIKLDQFDHYSSLVAEIEVTGRVLDILEMRLLTNETESKIFPGSKFTEISLVETENATDIDLKLSASNSINFPFTIEITLYR